MLFLYFTSLLNRITEIKLYHEWKKPGNTKALNDFLLNAEIFI